MTEQEAEMIEQEEREKEGKSSSTEENGTQSPPQEGKKDEKKVEKEQLSKVIYEGRVHHEYTKDLTWMLALSP